MTINELGKEAYQIAKNKGFWDKNRNIGELLMLTTSELGEALEAHRKNHFHFKKSILTLPPNEEIWKDIPIFEGMYMISNLGNVKNIGYYTINKLNKKQWNAPLILRPGKTKGGYRTVVLGKKTYKISRLVANAFLTNEKKLPIVNHINGVKTDDYISNLEWCTSSDNNKHALSTGLINRERILKLDDKINISFDWKSGVKAIDIHKKYPHLSLSAIKNICRKYEQYTDCFEFEIADAIIRLLDLCVGYNIDIEYFIKRKMQFNSTRNKLHGKMY